MMGFIIIINRSSSIGQQQIFADHGVGSENLSRRQTREPLICQPIQNLVFRNVDAVCPFGKIHIFLAQQLFNDHRRSIRGLGSDQRAAQHGHLRWRTDELLVKPAIVLAQKLILVGVIGRHQRL